MFSNVQNNNQPPNNNTPQGGNMFGASQNQQNSAAGPGGIFGASSQPSGNTLFGASGSQKPPAFGGSGGGGISGGLFTAQPGNQTNANPSGFSGGMFQNNNSQNNPMFGAATNKAVSTNAPNSSAFFGGGAGASSSQTQNSNPPQSLFGKPPATNVNPPQSQTQGLFPNLQGQCVPGGSLFPNSQPQNPQQSTTGVPLINPLTQQSAASNMGGVGAGTGANLGGLFQPPKPQTEENKSNIGENKSQPSQQMFSNTGISQTQPNTNPLFSIPNTGNANTLFNNPPLNTNPPAQTNANANPISGMFSNLPQTNQNQAQPQPQPIIPPKSNEVPKQNIQTQDSNQGQGLFNNIESGVPFSQTKPGSQDNKSGAPIQQNIKIDIKPADSQPTLQTPSFTQNQQHISFPQNNQQKSDKEQPNIVPNFGVQPEKPKTLDKTLEKQSPEQKVLNMGGPQQEAGSHRSKESAGRSDQSGNVEKGLEKTSHPTFDDLKQKGKESLAGVENRHRESSFLTENLQLRLCEQNNQTLLDILKNESNFGGKEIIYILESKQVLEKLEKVLAYYKTSEEDQHFKKYYDEGKVKWNSKIPLNNISKELIALISEQSNIGIRHSFNLLDFYFRNDPRSFNLIIHYQDNMPTDQKAQLSRIADKINTKIKMQISKERIRLLQVIYRLLSLTFIPHLEHPEKEAITHFMKKFLRKYENFIKILWGNYLMICSTQIPDNLPSYEEMNLWVENTLNEEYMLLKCIFLICRFQGVSPEFNYEMLDCFYNQSFQGSFQTHSNQKNLKIQEYYQNQLRLAQNINDISILILMANMSLDNIDSNVNSKDINPSSAPYSLFYKTGDKLFHFFLNAKDLQEISLIFMAFRSQVILFNLLFKNSPKPNEIPKHLYEYDLNMLVKYENVNYLSYVRDMLHHEIFKDSEDFFVVLEFKLLIKSWVNLLGITITDSEILQNYDFYTDILYHCLNEPYIVNLYWEEDFKKQKDLSGFVTRLMSFFPLKSSKFIKLLSALITKNNYSASNIIKILGDMSTYTTEAREIDSETVFSINEPHNAPEIYKSSEDLTINEFNIPKGTQYRLIHKSIENEEIPLVFQWNLEYNYWNTVFKDWTLTLNKLTEKPLENIDVNLVASIKLICKALVADPRVLFMLEQYLTQRKAKSSIYSTGTTTILLLIDSLFYFQRLKHPTFALFSHIISALNALIAYEDRNYKTSICFMIQLHPLTVFNVEKNRPFDIVEHPFFEIVSLIKRFDYTIEHNTKKYNPLLELLNFCYEIFKNNEFPLDLFPDENYVKFSYSNNTYFEMRLQDLSNRIQELHQSENEWNYENIEEINRQIESMMHLQIKSTFLDDFLKTIYQYILLNYDRFLFLPNELIKKFQIGNYLFKITRLLLSKFSLNVERVNIYLTQNIENPLLKLIAKHLNSTNIQDFILKTLEVHATLENMENLEDKEASTCLENKNWTMYIQNSQNELDYSLRMAFRNMLASCLSTLESIITLIDVYNENKSMNNEANNANQMEVNNIELIDYFYKIFSNKEEMFYYQQNYITQNSSKQISMNLILAISSLINFEVYKDLKVINETINNVDAFLPIHFSEMELEANQSFLYSADFSLGPNILLNGKVKSNLYQDSISTLSLRLLSKLLLFWEGLSSSKKPLLNELFISISLQSETGTSFNYILYKEMIKILFNHGAQIDDAIAVLELLLICLHSQKGFLDPLLKDTSLLSNIPNKIKLNEKFQEFCAKVVMNQEPEKVNKQFLFHFLLLICEIFKKEETCKSFVSKMRNNISFFQDLTNTIFSAFKADSNYLKSVNDLISTSNNIPVDQQMKTCQNQYNRLKMEFDIINGLSNNYMVLTVIQFICNEILKQPKNVATALSQTFNKQFFNWLTYYSFNKSKKMKPYFKTNLDYFLNELANVKNLILPINEEKNFQNSRYDISSYRSIYLKTIQPKQRLVVLKESSGNILEKGLYQILNSNDYGYGKNFLFDSQELFFSLKLCNYKNDFIYKLTLEMQSFNLFNSIMDVEFKCLEGWVKLFSFISSLGEEGIASSTMIYDSFIPSSQRLLNELFKNQKEASIINPNNSFVLEKGFIGIYSENGSDPEEKSWKFLKTIIKYVINEFYNEKYDYKKDDIFRRYLNQHVNLLINAFSCLHYLTNKKNLTQNNYNFVWDLKGQTFSFAQNVLTNILQYPQLTEINITNFVTFMFYFLSFLDSFDVVNQNEDPQLNKTLCEALYELLKKNLDSYPLVVYCLILLIKKDPINYVNYFYKEERKIVEHIIEKLSHTDTTFQESIANIKFLIEICQIEKGCMLLKELGLINELCQNPKLKEQFDEYKEENRNSSHILWCWILVLYRVFVKGLISSPGDMNSALFFIKTYSQRIERVLAIPLALSKDTKNSKLFSANIKLNISSNFKYSLAYLEELDYILQLLSVFFLDSKQWKEINKSQFDRIVFYLSICTIKLFKSNFSYNENFFPMTRYEKKLSEMYGSDKSLPEESKNLKGIQPNDVMTSTATPMKMAINPKKDLNEPMKPSSREILNTLTQYYNPSLFIFKIEICYQNILLSLMFNLTQSFPYSDLCLYFDEQSYTDIKAPNNHPKYENYYWEFFSESINDCQIYKRQTAQKWIAHEESLKKALRKLEVVRNSVETGLHSGSLNTLEKIPDFDLLIKYSITALIMSFEVAALHFEMFLEYKKLWNVLISDIIKMYKERTTQNIEESEKLLLKHIAKYEEIPNFSLVNFSADGSVDKRGLMESKSEMSESQKRISFMTCIKYHIYNLKI